MKWQVSYMIIWSELHIQAKIIESNSIITMSDWILLKTWPYFFNLTCSRETFGQTGARWLEP